MNILLSLKKFSHIGYYIHEARTKAKERKKHHRDRLNLSNDQIKYLDKVVIPEGCSYQVNDHTFSSIDKALANFHQNGPMRLPHPSNIMYHVRKGALCASRYVTGWGCTPLMAS